MKKGRNNRFLSPDQDAGLPKTEILRGRRKFQQLFEQDAVTLHARKVQLRFKIYTDAEKECLMGFIVKKKLGAAVKRNRIRRRLKEAYRLNRHGFPELVQSLNISFHGVLMAKTIDLDFNQAQQNVIELLDKARRHLLSTIDSDI